MRRFLELFTKTHYSFEGKKHYENVLALLYRHWFVILSRLIFFAFLAGLVFIVYRLVLPYAGRFGLVALADLVFYLYLMIWWYGLFRTLMVYVLDTWVVTDHRIIDSRQHGLFRREVAELNLSKIQDISVSVKGIIPTFLDFGNLEVQTAGVEQKFLFREIPHPQAVKDIIMHAHNEYVSSHIGGKEVHET